MTGTSAWRKFFRNRIGMISLAVVAAFFCIAAGFEIYSIVCEQTGTVPAYQTADANAVYVPPSRLHWLGTDYQGRDVFLRAAAGCATAFKVGLAAAGIAAGIGVVLGMLAGFCGGKLDELIVWLYSVFASMPTLLFILAFALLFSRGYLGPEMTAVAGVLAAGLHTEPGMLAVYLAIGLTGWITLCRVVRGETMKLRTMSYVEAARVAGVRTPVILFRHILPNVFHLVIIYFTLNFAGAILLEVIVSYLGLGVQSAPSWGVMISDGQERLWRGVWWEIAGASGFLFLLVLALNLLGDALRDALDPKD